MPANMKNIIAIAWNNNGVGNKLEKTDTEKLLINCDIISHNEIKTTFPISFPGYVTFRIGFVIIGDMNTRFGKSVRQLLQ